MTVVRVIFDGKTFVPQQPVTLAPDSEGVIYVPQNDPAAQAKYEDELRAYYQNAEEANDNGWEKLTASELRGAWDEE